jgi:hypothetical protein
MPDSNEQAIANKWREKGKTQYRRSRNEEIARGGSPPPKFDEENLFTEGDSRKRTKPVYRMKEDITDKIEDKERDSVEQFSNGRLNAPHVKLA